MKIREFGCPWSHDDVRYRELPNGIEWCNGNGDYDSVVIFDNHIKRTFDWMDKPIKKYAWIAESRAIVPEITGAIKQDPTAFTDQYDFIFTSDMDLVDLHERIIYVTNPASITWIENPDMYKKSKLISMISSNKNTCRGHKLRLKWVDHLKDSVDLYGRGFRQIDKKEYGLVDYMFSVAIENASYETYFTEKILDCFATGTIPIYWGSPDIGEFFNMDGIIQLTDDFDVQKLTPELYNSKIHAVEDNLNRIMNMDLPEDELYKFLSNQ